MDWLNHFVLLFPHGTVALAERNLMLQAFLFMLIVAVPVFGLIFFFAWHYRAGNTKAKYTPDWAHSNLEELIWWAIPLEIVLVLGALTWGSTHELDPYKPLSGGEPLTVEVVSLNWKWLFIYPAQKIATVNYLAVPAGVPVRFLLTSDAPMNAFWIPALGGQEMTMPGMQTQLNLKAPSEGTFVGMSSNFSGEGFSGMQFAVRAMSADDFAAWAADAASSQPLTFASYQALAKPSSNVASTTYALGDETLYTKIMSQYMDMAPSPAMEGMHH